MRIWLMRFFLCRNVLVVVRIVERPVVMRVMLLCGPRFLVRFLCRTVSV